MASLTDFQPKPMKPRRKKPAKGATPAELLECMSYLHGDVIDGEFEAACCFEYARESDVLREAARLRASEMSDPETTVEVEAHFQCGHWFIQHPWGFIWQCPSFPAKSWNQLGENERAELLLMFPTTEIQPLRMNEVPLLDAMGVFDDFKAMAAKATEMRKKDSGRSTAKPKVYPVLPVFEVREGKNRETPWVRALFTLNFSKGKERLLDEFDKWLQLPENRKRFVEHKRNQIGKTGVFKDRLKDLASWRLYRERGCDKALQFAAANRLRDKNGCPRAFHDQRKDPTKKLPLYEMPLYSEESAFQKAEAKAKKFRGELIPWEFGEFAKEAERQEKVREQRWAQIFAEVVPQISKSSS